MIIMGASFFLMKPSEADLKKERIAAHADSLKKGLIKTPGAITTANYKDTSKAKAPVIGPMPGYRFWGRYWEGQ